MVLTVGADRRRDGALAAVIRCRPEQAVEIAGKYMIFLH